MSINIFNLEFCQPLVWVVLALAVLLVMPNVFLYNEFSGESICKDPRRLKIFNWVMFAVIAVLWVVIIAFNHTTVWQDIVNFAFVIGFSFVFAAVAIIAFMMAIVTVIFILLICYYIVMGIVELCGRVHVSESEDDFE